MFNLNFGERALDYFIYIYDEKFVLKLYLRKFLSSPAGIEPVSPDCRYIQLLPKDPISNQKVLRDIVLYISQQF